MQGIASVLGVDDDAIDWVSITDSRRRKLLSSSCSITFGVTYSSKLDEYTVKAFILATLSAAMSDGSLVSAIQAAASALGVSDTFASMSVTGITVTSASPPTPMPTSAFISGSERTARLSGIAAALVCLAAGHALGFFV